ncbi:MAG: S8 family serine peptidase [Bacteroidales bacterium]|nr:S8 family serine peptidase [Bacteroidales bacterium]
MKKKVFEAKAKDLVAIYHNGAPLYQRYSQLRNVLMPLGEQYAELLCEPQIIGDRIIWHSQYVDSPVPITALPDAEKASAQARANSILSEISRHCQQLRADGRSEYANVLEQAVQVPDYGSILYQAGRIVLAQWGFAYTGVGGSQQSIPILQEKIPVHKPQVSDAAHIGVPVPPSPSAPKPSSAQVSKVSEASPAASAPSAPVPPPPPYYHNTDTVSADKPRKGMPGWLWFVLGALLMLILLLILRGCSGCNDDVPASDNNGNHNGGATPDRPYDGPGDPFFDTIRQVPPVDTTKIIHDPDVPGDRPILSNAVNIALDKGVDTKQFIISLSHKYPDHVEVVFADTTVKLLQVRVPDGGWKDWMDSLKALPEVRLAFPNSLFSESSMPDPGFSNPKQSWYFDDIEAFEAWKYTKGDSSVIVAIADNCFDLSHPELAGKIVMPYNVNTGNDDIHLVRDQGNMHGTHVAGTAVGNSNDGGVCGIAPNCRLMPIQIADDNGQMQSISIVAAALYAIHHGAAVVNFSLGAYFGEISPAEQNQLITGYGIDEAKFWNELYDFANDENCVFVLAAGNENILAGCDPFARSGKVLVVSAYQDSQRSPKAGFSNFGEYSNISAPGVEIYSSVPGGRYDFLQGTSMAAPIVTGAVALIKSKFPALSASEIVSVIKQSAKPLDSRPAIGPLLQIAKALKLASDGVLMEIPEDAEDASFAAGNWRSTTDLHNVDSGMEVKVLFHINADGTGTIEYREANGNVFTAPLSVEMDNGTLVITQLQEALGDHEGGYDPCVIRATRDGDGRALCHAEYQDASHGADFNMVKIVE